MRLYFSKTESGRICKGGSFAQKSGFVADKIKYMYLKYRGVFFSGRFLITLKIRTAFTSAQEPKISLFFIKRNAMSTFDK